MSTSDSLAEYRFQEKKICHSPEATLSSGFAAISLYLSYATLYQRLKFSSDMISVWRPQTAGGHSQRAPAIWDAIPLSCSPDLILRYSYMYSVFIIIHKIYTSDPNICISLSSSLSCHCCVVMISRFLVAVTDG